MKEPVGMSKAARDKEIVNTKDLRVRLDETLVYLAQLEESRPVYIARTKIQEAIMWLGMNLKALGEADPYPNSRDTTNTIVDPTAQGLHF